MQANQRTRDTLFSFRSLFKSSAEATAARELYTATILASRAPAYFTAWGVPDTPEGRYETLALTAFLMLRRLKSINGAESLAQTYFDLMFDDIDANLRELGVGDISVGKKVKKLASGFYGRIKAYDKALDDTDGDLALAAALRRFPFRSIDVDDQILNAVIAHIRAEDTYLAAQSDDAFLDGAASFSAAEVVAGEGTP